MRNGSYKLLDLDNGTQRFYKIDTDTLETTNLLTRALNATETTNYNYLCNQMTNLVGTGGFCTLTPTQEVNKGLEFTISPNPTQDRSLRCFYHAIVVLNHHEVVEVELSNLLCHLVIHTLVN